MPPYQVFTSLSPAEVLMIALIIMGDINEFYHKFIDLLLRGRQSIIHKGVYSLRKSSQPFDIHHIIAQLHNQSFHVM